MVDLHSLAELDQGAVSFNADGANSLVDLSALTSFSTNGSYDSSIRVANGGEVRVNDGLTALNQVDLTLGLGTLKTVQLTSITNASLSVSESGVDLSGIGSLDGVSIYVSGGAMLSLSQLTSYASTSSATIQASGAGSRLDLSGLTTLDGPAGFNTIQVNAVSGGVVDLHSLARLRPGSGLVQHRRSEQSGGSFRPDPAFPPMVPTIRASGSPTAARSCSPHWPQK